MLPVYEAAQTYLSAKIPLIIFAGINYGAGSSRDWAAKAPAPLGVRAIVARSFERIHRSNLTGMGVFPLQFTAGDSVENYHLTCEEIIDVIGLDEIHVGTNPITINIGGRDGSRDTIQTTLRVDSDRKEPVCKAAEFCPT